MRIAVHRCAGCGSELCWPQPSDEWLEEIYAGYGALRRESSCGRPRRQLFESLLRECPLDLHDGTVLEVGGARGDGADAVRRLWPTAEVTIIEPHPPEDELAAGPGIQLEITSLEDWLAGGPAKRFDLVLAFDVLEHLRDPSAALRSLVRQHLAPGGQLIASFPNAEAIVHRALGRHWMQYKPEHLFYFSRAGIRELARAAGLHTVSLAPLTKRLSVDYALGVGVGSGPAASRRACRWLDGVVPQALRGLRIPLRTGEWLWVAHRLGA